MGTTETSLFKVWDQQRNFPIYSTSKDTTKGSWPQHWELFESMPMVHRGHLQIISSGSRYRLWHTPVSVRMYVCMYVYIYIYVWRYISVHIYSYLSISTYTYISILLFIYVSINLSIYKVICRHPCPLCLYLFLSINVDRGRIAGQNLWGMCGESRFWGMPNQGSKFCRFTSIIS